MNAASTSNPARIRTGYSNRAPLREAEPARRQVGPLAIGVSSVRKLLTLWAALVRARSGEEALRAYQLRRLKKLLAWAERDVDLYRERWAEAGVAAHELRTLADLGRFPIIEKDDVRDRFPDGALRHGTRLERCRVQQTSGSSGRCMEIALTLRCDDARNIYTQRMYGWHGFRFWRTAAYLFPYQLPFENNLGIYPNVWVDAKREPDDALDEIGRIRPAVLAATPSDVLDLLEGASEGRDLRALGVGTLCLHSEPLSADERAYFSERFGCPVRTNYYCNEVWAIANECEHGRMHEFPDNVVLELLDDEGQPVPDGTPGQVVVTGLNGFAQPFIRYRLGDLAVRSPDRNCPCGRKLPILERIEGRDDDVFVHPDGRAIHPAKITVAVKSPCFEHPGLQVFRDYQIVQTAPDHVVVRVVPGRDREPFEACAREGVARLQRLLQPGVHVDLEVCDTLDGGPGGKRKIFTREPAVAGATTGGSGQ